MSWFYYDVYGEKQGPHSVSLMKDLIKEGVIKWKTKVENANGLTSDAGDVKEFEFPPRPIVIYGDDKDDEVKDFEEKYANDFDIRSVVIRDAEDEEKCLGLITDLINMGTPPKHILLDLFRPKADHKEEMADLIANLVTKEEETLKELRVRTYEASHPYGVDMLKKVRGKCPDVPIAIFTKHRSVVSDANAADVMKNNATFIMKNQSPDYISGTMSLLMFIREFERSASFRSGVYRPARFEYAP